MRSVIHGWSDLGLAAGVIIVALTGVTWAARSLQGVLFNPDYWNPVTPAAFFSVYLYSAAFLLTGASMLILRDVTREAPALTTPILVVAAACVVTGVANGIEDALGLRGFGLVYVVGIVVSGIGMFVIAAMFRATPARRLMFVPLLGGIALAFMTQGGGVLGIVAWLGFGVVLIRERGGPNAAAIRA